jgi:hypothetical protein
MVALTVETNRNKGEFFVLAWVNLPNLLSFMGRIESLITISEPKF